MGTAYPTQAVSGYNSSPPSDDGSQTASNQLKWSTIKTKLPDPLKTALEAINSALVTAFDYSVNSQTASYTTIPGDHMRTVEAAPSVSTAITFSLGDCAAMGTKYIVRFKNSGTGVLTISRITGTDTLNGVASDVTMSPGQSMWVGSSGATSYINLDNFSTALRLAASSAQTITSDVNTTGAWKINGTATVESTGTIVITSKNLGTISSGTVTPNPQVQALQHYTNGGAHTLAPSANAGSVLVDITNNGSAGAVTTSGFTKVSGDAFTTTNTNKFRCHISVGNAGSLLVVEAMQ